MHKGVSNFFIASLGGIFNQIISHNAFKDFEYLLSKRPLAE